MNGDESRIIGWYGKIASLGDFASRRLPARFLVPWDDWLQRAMVGSRAVLGARWLETYLTTPVWRFLLMPGVCGKVGWAGVMLPSVDRVGRYFPLSLAMESPVSTLGEARLKLLSQWLDGIEIAAVATLDPKVTLEDFEGALAACPLPPLGLPDDMEVHLQQQLAAGLSAHAAIPGMLNLPSSDDFAPLLSGTSTCALVQAAVGKSLWWSRNRDGAQAALMYSDGLPAPEGFVALLTGEPSALAPT